MENEELRKEFKVLNLSIEKFSICYGVFLIVWGIIVSFVSGSSSATSYIPSFEFSLDFFLFSYKIFIKKKLFMHIVVILVSSFFLAG